MQCKVEGCDREAHYKAACLCQKHYFRQWRYGTTDTTRHGHAKQSYQNNRGYRFIRAPSHPLRAKGQSYVGEHRLVLYEAIGPGPMECELCAAPLTWVTCCVDHIDNNPSNNERSNLRPTCNRCNTRRGIGPPVSWNRTHKVMFGGEMKTPAEWARDPRVSVAGRTIVYRLKLGMSHEEALFSPKVTHNGNLPKPVPRKTQFKHQRKNAIRIEIDGVTMTAAEWSRHPDCEVTARGLVSRIKNGWPPSRAVFAPNRQTESIPA